MNPETPWYVQAKSAPNSVVHAPVEAFPDDPNRALRNKATHVIVDDGIPRWNWTIGEFQSPGYPKIHPYTGVCDTGLLLRECGDEMAPAGKYFEIRRDVYETNLEAACAANARGYAIFLEERTRERLRSIDDVLLTTTAEQEAVMGRNLIDIADPLPAPRWAIHRRTWDWMQRGRAIYRIIDERGIPSEYWFSGCERCAKAIRKDGKRKGRHEIDVRDVPGHIDEPGILDFFFMSREGDLRKMYETQRSLKKAISTGMFDDHVHAKRGPRTAA